MGKGAQILGGATLVALLLGWLAYAGVEEGAFRYYKTLGEFRARPRTSASLRACTATWRWARSSATSPAKEVRFRVQEVAPHAGGSADEAMPVIYASLEAPDLFKDGAEVVVEGTLQRDGRLRRRQRARQVPVEVRGRREAERAANAPPAT